MWDWYAQRRDAVARVAPNPAHAALVEIERRVPRFLLATQNVDGLHARAGSARMVELHGNLARVRCSRCALQAEHWKEGAPGEPPRCAACGAFLRPDVVWFDEPLPIDAQRAARDAARACDVFLVVGTSADVYPAAALPDLAQEVGARVIEVNPSPTPLTPRASDVLRGPAGVVLPALVRAAFG